MQDRYLYKIGGQTDIEKIERLDLREALKGFRGAKKRAYSDIISSQSMSSGQTDIELVIPTLPTSKYMKTRTAMEVKLS